MISLMDNSMDPVYHSKPFKPPLDCLESWNCEEYHVPPTNPSKINSLWEEVQSKATMSTRGCLPKESDITCRGKPYRKVGGNGLSGSGAASLSDPTESQTTPEIDNTRMISPHSSKFTKLILHPRGIVINETNRIVPGVFAHFNTTRPPPGETIDYAKILSLCESNIWVLLNDQSIRNIVAEYREMRSLGLCEEEFATFAKENFLRGDLRSRKAPQDGTWRADRMLQLLCLPKESAHWRIPPLLDDSTAAEMCWSWDIRPDCAYWLSLKGFSPQYRFQIQNCAFVRDWITCPYFTIEFKRGGESEDVAVRQVCAAGALALFNRHCLYHEARQSRPSLDFVNIRHYTLTFNGHKFVFWILKPTCDDSGLWTGCTMTRLFGADCTDEYAIRELADWINEIHRWGLSQYGADCARDIKSVLNSGGLRTSDVHEALK